MVHRPPKGAPDYYQLFETCGHNWAPIYNMYEPFETYCQKAEVIVLFLCDRQTLAHALHTGKGNILQETVLGSTEKLCSCEVHI
jgi:hypothetical protein